MDFFIGMMCGVMFVVLVSVLLPSKHKLVPKEMYEDMLSVISHLESFLYVHQEKINENSPDLNCYTYSFKEFKKFKRKWSEELW